MLENVASEQALDVSGGANIQRAATKVTFSSISLPVFRPSYQPPLHPIANSLPMTYNSLM